MITNYGWNSKDDSVEFLVRSTFKTRYFPEGQKNLIRPLNPFRSCLSKHKIALPSMDSAKKLGEPEIIALMQNPVRKEQGLAALMELFQRPLYCHIRKMVGDHDDSDDILQNTFVKAWRFFDGFRAESSLKTWLFRIATNECLTLLEKRKKRNLSDLRDIENNLGHSEQVTSTMTGEDIQQRLEAAVASLPDKQKQVFVMKYYDEMKYSEMVEILGGTEGSLKASFHHAVKKIENYLQAG